VTTASVERVFLTTKYLNSQICNKMDDQWLNDRLATFIETYVLVIVSNDIILVHFQKMSDRLFSLKT